MPQMAYEGDQMAQLATGPVGFVSRSLSHRNVVTSFNAQVRRFRL